MSQLVHHNLAHATQRLVHTAWNMVVTPVVSLPSTMMTWQERAATRAALEELDQRLLRDMGIDRSTATQEARKPFWKA